VHERIHDRELGQARPSQPIGDVRGDPNGPPPTEGSEITLDDVKRSPDAPKLVGKHSDPIRAQVDFAVQPALAGDQLIAKRRDLPLELGDAVVRRSVLVHG
jgi:hypothetical protein